MRKNEALLQLKGAKALFDKGVNEGYAREHLEDRASVIQKLWAICRLNWSFPELDFYNRFFLPPESPAYIPIGKVRGSALVRLARAKEARDKKDRGQPLNPTEAKSWWPIHAADVEKYVRETKQ